MILLLMSLALAVLATFMTLRTVVLNHPVDGAIVTLILCLSVVFLIISEIVT